MLCQLKEVQLQQKKTKGKFDSPLMARGPDLTGSVDDEVVAYRCVKIAQHSKWSHS